MVCHVRGVSVSAEAGRHGGAGEVRCSCASYLLLASVVQRSHKLKLHQLNDSDMPSETPTDPRNPSSSLSTTISDTAHPRRGSGRRKKKGPKPWYVLKLSVALAASAIAYSAYVYIGRLCIPMIRREHNSLGSRTLGSELDAHYR